MNGGCGRPDPTYETYEVSERHFSRNFWLGVINGTLFTGGMAFSEPGTILPVFVSLFTGSSILIGLTGTLVTAGWLLPQVAVARYVENMPRKMRLWKIAALFRLSSWLCLTGSVLWADRIDHKLYLAVFFGSLASCAILGSLNGITFMDIVGKTIPPDKRGRYFGYRMFFSGVVAALAGIVVAIVLGNAQRFPFPKNYFVLFFLTFVFTLSAVAVFLFVVEPDGRFSPNLEGGSEHLHQVRRVLSEDRNFRTFLHVMIFAHTSSLSLPFYIIYATRVLHAPTDWVGLFVTIEMLATTVSNLAWGYVGDKRGYRGLTRVSTLMSIMAPVVALLSPNYHVFSFVFALKGSGAAGILLCRNNYPLEIAPIARRPTYVGILNSFVGFVLLLSVVGGVIIDRFSFPALFATTTFLMSISVVGALRLEEPRRSAPTEEAKRGS